MQALVSSHLHVKNITTKDFFRTAYVARFGYDCSDTALANDAKNFDEAGRIPDYVIKYMIKLYGVQ